MKTAPKTGQGTQNHGMGEIDRLKNVQPGEEKTQLVKKLAAFIYLKTIIGKGNLALEGRTQWR